MDTIIKNCENGMNNAIDSLKKSLSVVRAGRANPAILDRVVVNYYGAPTPLSQMAAISVSENRILVIQPWDKSAINDIEKAIIKADIGITPNNDGSVVRLVFPQPTEERRKELCKEVRTLGEEGKIAVRAVRRDANDELKSLKSKNEVSEDEITRAEKEVQELTDKYIKEVDKIVEAKEAEVLEI